MILMSAIPKLLINQLNNKHTIFHTSLSFLAKTIAILLASSVISAILLYELFTSVSANMQSLIFSVFKVFYCSVFTIGFPTAFASSGLHSWQMEVAFGCIKISFYNRRYKYLCNL